MPSISIPRECDLPAEHRAALVPADVARLTDLGLEVAVQAGLGDGFQMPDAEYSAAGARVVADRDKLLASADVVFRLHAPPPAEAALLKKSALHLSLLDPFRSPELVVGLRDAGVMAVSMNMVPRITRAQAMDALTSQASLAGYSAVIRAAAELRRVFPMMMTAAGTIQPARVFVIGVGVAGLQAIAVAKRLGARVEAFDTRPVVAEQVRSLGARFVQVDLGETGETEGGYARELTAEQMEMQRTEMARVCARSDVVITAAQVFGRPAPVIVTSDILDSMKPGSVVVDTAVDSVGGGGNVEGVRAGEIFDRGGVKLIGLLNLPAAVAAHASQMYSSNLCTLLEDLWDKEAGAAAIDLDDEIQAGCLLTRDGTVVHAQVAEKVAAVAGAGEQAASEKGGATANNKPNNKPKAGKTTKKDSGQGGR